MTRFVNKRIDTWLLWLYNKSKDTKRDKNIKSTQNVR